MDLDTRATYHVCLNRAWFSSLEKLDGYFTVMGDDHPCNVKGMGTVCIKMINTRTEKGKVCTSTQKESYLCWCFENIRSFGIYTRWCSQDDQRLNGGYEERPSEKSLLLEG